MACPFFLPTEKYEGGLWPHPSRLPLGAGWRGRCCAAHQLSPSDQELQEYCNLGYPRCSHVPQNRVADAVRFCVAHSDESGIMVRFALERDHRPSECGTLEFGWDGRCRTPHKDPCIATMAQCYVQTYIERRQH